MARVGGRNRLIAVPVGLICLVVVAGLVWFGMPGFRVIGDWIAGGAPTLTRTQATEQPADSAAPAETGAITECRDIYPDPVWSLFALRADARLTQDVSSARTAATAAVQVAEPKIQISCSWSVPDQGAFSSTIAQVKPEMPALIETALRGENFTCTNTDGDIRCVREHDSMTEVHTLRDQLWIWQQLSGSLSGEVSADDLEDVTERILDGD